MSTSFNRNTDNGIDELQDEQNDIVSKYEGDVDMVISGDFNSRSGKQQCFIIDDDSKSQPHISECYNNDSFCKLRQNKDHVVNTFW